MSFDYTDRFRYLPSTDVYARQVARHFDMDLYEYCALPSQRTTDVYYITSDYEGDEYANDVFDDRKDTKDGAEYIQKLSDASVISIQIGYNGLTQFALQNIITRVSEGKVRYNVDLDQIFTEPEMQKLLPFAMKCEELLEKSIPAEFKDALNAFIAGLDEAKKASLAALLGEDKLESLADAKDILDYIKDNVIYAIVAHLVHFDGIVRTLHEINPDAEIYVMGLVNPTDNMEAGFVLGGQKLCVSLDQLVGGVYDLFNSYMRIFSPYSDTYYYVENMEHFNTFGDEMLVDEDIARRALYDIHNGDDRRAGYENKDSEAYRKADAETKGLMQALNNTIFIDLGKLISGLPDADTIADAASELSAKVSPYLAHLTEFDENGELTMSYFDQVMLHVYMMQTLHGLYAHPTQKTHDAEAQLLIDAMENKTVDPLALAYHEAMSPIEDVIEVLNTSESVDAFLQWCSELCPDEVQTIRFGKLVLPDLLGMLVDVIKNALADFGRTLMQLFGIKR